MGGIFSACFCPSRGLSTSDDDSIENPQKHDHTIVNIAISVEPLSGHSSSSFSEPSAPTKVKVDADVAHREHSRAQCGHICSSEVDNFCCWCQEHSIASNPGPVSIKQLKMSPDPRDMCRLCRGRQSTVLSVLQHVEEQQRISLELERSRPSTPKASDLVAGSSRMDFSSAASRASDLPTTNEDRISSSAPVDCLADDADNYSAALGKAGEGVAMTTARSADDEGDAAQSRPPPLLVAGSGSDGGDDAIV